MLTHIKINNIDFQEDSSLTILEVAKKRGIKIPTLCYLKRDDCNFEHKPASCRICIVEVKGRRNLVPACSTLITEGMEVYTNNKRVRAERKCVLELLLSNHPNDCLTCNKSTKCSLQTLASELGVHRKKFTGPLSQVNEDIIHESIVRNPSKCILCGRCVAICKKVQGIHAISASQRGFKTIISASYDCVNCGQCVQVCPTGALLQVDNSREVDALVNDSGKYCVVQTAPAVRVSLGEEFGFAPGDDVTGKMVTALKMIGFKKVFDTNFAADLTIMEEATELLERLNKNEDLPLITSCCPGWIKFLENNYPEFLKNPSSCKSPQEMFSAIAKTYFAKKMDIDPKDMIVVSLMPCIAKKQELKRNEEKFDEFQPTDISISTKEFSSMLKRHGIDLACVPDSPFDDPMGESTGAADIFANTGGVLEAAIRTAYMLVENSYPSNLRFESSLNIEGIKDSYITIGGKKLHVCVVSGLANARIVLDQVKNKEVHYDAIEIMACPGGCINGGGQPLHRTSEQLEVLKKRREGIQKIDRNKSIRISCDNEQIQKLYNEFLGKPGSELAHKLLHTTYKDTSNE